MNKTMVLDFAVFYGTMARLVVGWALRPPRGRSARVIMHPLLPHVSFSAGGQASPTSHVRLEPLYVWFAW